MLERGMMQYLIGMCCRADLAEAVSRYGGYSDVAERLGWKKPSLPRRRWGYWSNLENIKAEVDDVTDEMNIPRGTLPSRQILKKLGYSSISKAIEAQGGFARVRAVSTCIRKAHKSGFWSSLGVSMHATEHLMSLLLTEFH
jgi:hypothetical protein